MNAEFNPKEIYDFDVSSPASFTFSDDGKFLFGSLILFWSFQYC